MTRGVERYRRGADQEPESLVLAVDAQRIVDLDSREASPDCNARVMLERTWQARQASPLPQPAGERMAFRQHKPSPGRRPSMRAESLPTILASIS